jgi:predicted metalloprotease with PDZ domain
LLSRQESLSRALDLSLNFSPSPVARDGELSVQEYQQLLDQHAELQRQVQRLMQEKGQDVPEEENEWREEALRLRRERERQEAATEKAAQTMAAFKPTIGIVFLSGHSHGVQITEVREGGPGARAGLRVGDIITQVCSNGKLRTKQDVYDAVKGVVPGDYMPFHILRHNKPRTLVVAMGAQGFTARQIAATRRVAALKDLDFDVIARLQD